MSPQICFCCRGSEEDLATVPQQGTMGPNDAPTSQNPSTISGEIRSSSRTENSTYILEPPPQFAPIPLIPVIPIDDLQTVLGAPSDTTSPIPLGDLPQQPAASYQPTAGIGRNASNKNPSAMFGRQRSVSAKWEAEHVWWSKKRAEMEKKSGRKLHQDPTPPDGPSKPSPL